MKVPFGLWTWVSSRNHVLGRSSDPPGKGAVLGDVSWLIVKYRDPACDQYSQLYLVGGSSDAAFCCQYCSNLLVITCDVSAL